MNPSFEGSPAQVEAFLSGAYRRIRRTTILLGLIGTIAAALGFGWRNGLGALAGAIVGYVNFVWLHHASRMMIERMLAPAGSPSRFRVVLGFAGRYAFVVIAAYVILKGWPQMLVSFIVALFFPIAAAMGEGVYEALADGRSDSRTN